MKMTVHTKLGVALAAMVIIPALALAQGPAPLDSDGPDGGGGPEVGMHRMGEGHGMGMHHRGGHGMGLAFLVNNPELRQKIGITDEQAAKIRQQTLEFRKAEIRSRADLEVKRLELHSLLAADTPDRAAIDKALAEAGAAQMALAKNGIEFHLAMRGALTPEQREKLKAMRHDEFQHHEAGPGEHHGMRHPGAPGAPQPPPPPAQ